MKRILNSYENDAEFNLGADMRSDVYNALADIAFKYVQRANKEGISEEVVYDKLDGAMDWFVDKFYEEGFGD
jgi:hypothetical protein